MAKNVILFMSDQQRADSLGCFGNAVARTPNLDRLGGRGARMTSHFTPNQICSPSRATLFSGLYPRHHGLTRNGVSLPEDLPLLSHDLQRAGYATHGVGKMHFQPILAPEELRMPDSTAFWRLPESAGWRGPFYGFDTVDLLIGESAASTEGGHYAEWLRRVAPDAAAAYLPENCLGERPEDLDEVWRSAIPPELHYNSWIADRACDFVEQADRDRPFFLFVSFPDPHHPFSPPAPWCDLFDPAEVPPPAVESGELDAMPDYIRANRSVSGGGDDDTAKSYLDLLLDPSILFEQGMMQTTERFSESSMRQAIAHTYGAVSMIDACIGRVLESLDATGRADETLVVFTPDHGELLGDHGLIRKGPAPYAQVLNIPLIVAGPGIAPGERDALTSHLDMKATLLDLTGVEGDAGDGRSFAPLLRGETPRHREHLLAEYHSRAIAEQYNQSLLTEDWRLTVYPFQSDWGELFDRRNDPGEHHNLYWDPAAASVKRRLQEQIAALWPPMPEAGLPSLAIY